MHQWKAATPVERFQMVPWVLRLSCGHTALPDPERDHGKDGAWTKPHDVTCPTCLTKQVAHDVICKGDLATAEDPREGTGVVQLLQRNGQPVELVEGDIATVSPATPSDGGRKFSVVVMRDTTRYIVQAAVSDVLAARELARGRKREPHEANVPE